MKSMGKSGILAHTKHKVARLQLQINLQFHFTVKLSKLGEIVKPIWLTGNAICKQTWLAGSKNPIWLTSCDTNVKTRLLLLLLLFQPGHSSYGLEMDMAMCSSWAHPWALSRLLGPVTSLGSSLNDRHSPWASGQLGKAPRPWPGWSQLEKAGEGWTRPLGLNRSELAGTTHWHTPLLANP